MDFELHPHLSNRMFERGANLPEVREVLEKGRSTVSRPPAIARTYVFAGGEWRGRVHQQKEVTVYNKHEDSELVVLTVLVRWGSAFPQR